MQRKVSVSLNDLTHEMIVKQKKLSVCGLPITTKQNNKAGTHTAKKRYFWLLSYFPRGYHSSWICMF